MEIDIRCLNCSLQFSSPDALTHHFNTDGVQCISTLEDNVQIPTPPAFRRGAGETNVTGQYHKDSGYVYGKGNTLLDRLKAHEYERCREHQVYYPFADEGEWELAKFLALNLNKTQISQFLKLRWVCLLSCCIDPHLITPK